MNEPGAFARAAQRRKRAKRRRWLALTAVVVVLLVAAAVAAYFLWFSDATKLAKAEVSGIKLLTEKQVLDAAQLPMGEPLATLDTEAVVQRVQQLPAVRSARVERVAPDSVRIEVLERVAVYQRTDRGKFQWIDDQGVIFHSQGEARKDLMSVRTAQTDVRLLRDIATVVEFVPANVSPRVKLIEAKAVDHIVLVLDDSDVVVWGSADDSELKSDVLSQLIKIDATVYDISAPSYPTTR